VTFGTGILGYIFYIVTRREYSYEVASDLSVTRAQAKLYKKHGFDINEYRRQQKEKLRIQKLLVDMKEEYGMEVNSPSLSTSYADW
jgi:hypothetical protein